MHHRIPSREDRNRIAAAMRDMDHGGSGATRYSSMNGVVDANREITPMRGLVFAIVFGQLCFGGFAQHVYTCAQQENWTFLLSGSLVFPVGIVHGWGVWLGFWG